jgi:hypothetical protein
VKDNFPLKPEAFQIIKSPFFPCHKMYDNTPAIHDTPAFIARVFAPVVEAYVFRREKIKQIPVEPPHVRVA